MIFFCFFVLLLGEYRDFPSDGSPSGGILFRFCLSLFFFSVSQGWIHFFSLPDGLCHLFEDHNPSSILICCVIYDLEGSNDTYPQDANLTFVGEIYKDIFSHLFCLVYFCLVLNKTTAATSRVYPCNNPLPNNVVPQPA